MKTLKTHSFEIGERFKFSGELWSDRYGKKART